MSALFDECQLRCLAALLDTLIPPDDFPGAWDAGVGDYLQRQLQGDLADLGSSYHDFLRCLDAAACHLHKRDFADLALDARSELLHKVENHQITASWMLEPGKFFPKIVEHCGEGYYSDPGNGGNREGIAWQMIGFEVRG
ncbi:MAG: gluconate 2-dehydrogenase subunit 3 family protein [Chloroflexi bacterium]|nr:gluconate 2-dehydrogenase subunit 3 family protein [Chloroflexota bacterium]MCY3715657.1 gluconate 2-dehydrogenase subunit 3 family protein [Chloroflexota bacterium]MDE2650605.1 gluconate 2-dehydrogenase subunit 3 family protein [Chloroflexota bacterium]